MSKVRQQNFPTLEKIKMGILDCRGTVELLADYAMQNSAVTASKELGCLFCSLNLVLHKLDTLAETIDSGVCLHASLDEELHHEQ